MGWLEWNRELGRSRDVLERIVALLLALAGLADRASSAADRRNLLAILRRGEAEVRAFVIAMARQSGTPVEPAAAIAHGQVERLAASFRALALILSAMLALARRFARLLPAGPQAGLPMAPRKSAGPKRLRWMAAMPALDTS